MMEEDSKTPLSDDECQEAHEEGENEEDEISDHFLMKMGDKAHVLTNPLEIRQAPITNYSVIPTLHILSNHRSLCSLPFTCVFTKPRKARATECPRAAYYGRRQLTLHSPLTKAADFFPQGDGGITGSQELHQLLTGLGRRFSSSIDTRRKPTSRIHDS